MKIVVLADGSSIHTEKWIKGLVLNGEDEVFLISMSDKKTRSGLVECIQESNIFHLKLVKVKEGGNNFGYIKKIYQTHRIIKKIKPDHINTIYLTSYGFIGSILKGKVSLSHFLIGSDIMVTPAKSFLYRLLTKFSLKKADLLICASKAIESKVKEYMGKYDMKILTQQYGVDDFVINYPKQEKTYDFVSNRAWVKNSNIIYILEIFKKIESRTRIILIGSGGEQEDEILKKIKSLKHAENPGVLPYDKNIDIVSKSRFFLSLTTSDGASLSLLEAMAVGAIPIVSNIEPNKEWITDGYNGFIIDLNNLNSAVKKIKEILDVPEEQLNLMMHRNIQMISEKASLRKNMKKYIDSAYSVSMVRR